MFSPRGIKTRHAPPVDLISRYMNTSDFFKGALITVIGFILIFSGYSLWTNYAAHPNLTAFSWYSAPELKNTSGKKVTKMKSGDGVVIEYHILYDTKSCWVTFQDTIVGPVTYQFQENITQTSVKFKTKVTTAFYFDLPDNLPEGKYKWVETIYTSCDGGVIPPYVLDTGIEFLIDNTPAVAPRPSKPEAKPDTIKIPRSYPKPDPNWVPMSPKTPKHHWFNF